MVIALKTVSRIVKCYNLRNQFTGVLKIYPVKMGLDKNLYANDIYIIQKSKYVNNPQSHPN